MSLLDEADALRAAIVHGPRCSIAVALEEMTEEDAADLRRLLAMSASRMPSSVIDRLLKTRGVGLAGRTVARHRRGDCSCKEVGGQAS